MVRVSVFRQSQFIYDDLIVLSVFFSRLLSRVRLPKIFNMAFRRIVISYLF